MTATRSESTPQAGQPAIVRAERAAERAQRWPSSICLATVGGMGSRQAIGSHSNSRTQPPIVEYVLSGTAWSSSKYRAGSHRFGGTSVTQYRPPVMLAQKASPLGASGMIAAWPTTATGRTRGLVVMRGSSVPCCSGQSGVRS